MMTVIITILLAITPLTILHVFPIIVTLIRKDENNQEGKYKYKTLIRRIPLTCTGILTCIGFSVFHFFSVIRFKQYGDEVLSSEDHIETMLLIYSIFSPTIFYIGFVLSAIILTAIILTKKAKEKEENGNKEKKENKNEEKKENRNEEKKENENEEKKEKGNKEWLLMMTAAVISMNFIYVGCYFLPYMLWAFIHNPFLTIFTHAMLVLVIVCLYLICLAIWRLVKLCCKKCKNDNGDKATKILNTMSFFCMALGITSSVVIFLYVSTYIITLGRFGDFEELNNLAPSLLIAVLGLFLLKPVYNHVMTDKNKDSKKCMQSGNNNQDPASQ